MATQSDWLTAAERMNRFVSLDPRLRETLADLSEDQAHEDKIAFKLEEGRVYGLRKEYYEMVRRRQLNRDMSSPPVEAHW